MTASFVITNNTNPIVHEFAIAHFFIVLFAYLLSNLAQPDTVSSYPYVTTVGVVQGITFEVTNHQYIQLHNLEVALASSGSFDVYYRIGGVGSTPSSAPVINAANGWTFVGSYTANRLSSGIPVPFNQPLDLFLAPGKYGFYISTPDLSFKIGAKIGYPGTTLFSDAVVDLNTGPGAGWYGPAPNIYIADTAQFVGSVIYYPILYAPYDVSTVSIDSIYYNCAGLNPVAATIRNLGSVPITTVDVNWSIDNVKQPTVTYSGLLDTIGGAGPIDDQVFLGNATLLANQGIDIDVWTSSPNGNTDPNANNDSAFTKVFGGMSGNYTIDSSGTGATNFLSFTDAVEALNSRKVCGPVVFNVKQDTYNQQISIDSMPGTSNINTITFQADSSNTAPVTLRYYATVTGKNYVLKLNGCSYVTFNGITFEPQGILYKTGIAYSENSHHNHIKNCKIVGQTTSFPNISLAMIFAKGAGINHNTFEANYVHGGSYGIYYSGDGSSPANLASGIIISGNTIENPNKHGIYTLYTDGLVVSENHLISNSSYTLSSGIYVEYASNGTKVIKNVIKSPATWPHFGIGIFNSDPGVTARGLVANNMVHAGSSTTLYKVSGLYLQNCSNFDIVHNNVVTEGKNTLSHTAFLDGDTNNTVYNNNFLNYGEGYAIYIDSSANGYDLDYNNLATSGVYLCLYDNSLTTPQIPNLASWQAKGFGQHSISIDSIFSNPDSLRTCHDSIVDRGSYLSGIATSDIDDEIRNNPPNIGADEYVTTYEPYSIGDTIEFCEGDSVELGTPVDYVTYHWSTSDTTPTIFVTTAGNYSVTIRGACATATDSIALIDIHPIADYDFEIDFDTREVQFTNLSLYGTSYYWDFGDGNTSASQDPLHTYLDTGTYEVNLTVMNPCDTIVFSKIVTISYTGLDQVGGQAVRMYPNPAGDHLYLDFGKVPYQVVQLEILDVKGQLRMKQQLSTNAPQKIDVSVLNRGIYVLRLMAGPEIITTQKLIVKE